MAIYSLIAEEQANQVWSVAEMCRVLEVSRSGFYDWQSRPPSQREIDDRQLAVEIEAIWECSAPRAVTGCETGPAGAIVGSVASGQ